MILRRMSNGLFLSIALAAATLSPASPGAVAPQAIVHRPSPPTAPEMEALFRRDWPIYAAGIRKKEGLAATPTSLISLPQVLCHPDWSGVTFECAAIVHFALANGRPSSALMVETLGRDEQGRLVQLIIIRELPVTK